MTHRLNSWTIRDTFIERYLSYITVHILDKNLMGSCTAVSGSQV